MDKRTIKSEESPFYIPKWLGVRPAALLEMGIFFILFFLYDAIFGMQDRMIGAAIHPFWIIVILMSAQYGAAEGLIAVALSTILLYAGNVPEQIFGQDYFDYQCSIYKLPFMWLFTALVVGEMQERKNRIRRDLEKKLRETEIREEEITRSYETLKSIKEGLESRLAGQMKSFVTTYEALKKMEEMKPAKVLLGVADLVRNVLNPQKFSLFAVGSEGLEPVTEWGWTDEDNYIRRFIPTSDLYINLVGKQKLLCILNREDELILKGEGLLAAPLIDESTGTIFGVLKIEALDIHELNLSQIEAFRSIAAFAGVAYAQASNYQKLLQNTIFDVELPIYSATYYELSKKHLSAICEAAKQPFSVVRLRFNDRLSKQQTLSFIYKLQSASSQIFGPLCQFYRTQPNALIFSLLIPLADIKSVEKRLIAFRSEIKKTGGESMQVEIEVLHEN
jgi:hypothetical protein